jgi:hypothetical protein
VTRGELHRVCNLNGDPKQYRSFVVVSKQTLIDSNRALQLALDL